MSRELSRGGGAYRPIIHDDTSDQPAPGDFSMLMRHFGFRRMSPYSTSGERKRDTMLNVV